MMEPDQHKFYWMMILLKVLWSSTKKLGVAVAHFADESMLEMEAFNQNFRRKAQKEWKLLEDKFYDTLEDFRSENSKQIAKRKLDATKFSKWSKAFSEVAKYIVCAVVLFFFFF